MPTAEQLAAWKPRRTASGSMDVLHSDQLVRELTGEFLALGYERRVAELAAASVVNMQMVPDFGLMGSDVRDGLVASQALGAIRDWAAQPVAQAKAA